MTVVRDFTDETRTRLTEEITEINQKTWNPVTDFIGDVLLRAGKWLNILSLNEDMSNVESYQKNVLDMTDMTKKELEQIFENVYAVDEEMAEKVSQLHAREQTYNEKLEALSSLIQPDFSICDASTIRSTMDSYNTKLENLDNEIAETIKKELEWAQVGALKESGKGIISSLVSAAVDIASAPLDLVEGLVTGGPLGFGKAFFSCTKSLIDDVFALGSNMVAPAMIGIGYFVYAFTGSNSTLEYATSSAEEYNGAEGFTDTLEASQKTEGENAVTSFFLGISKKADTVDAMIDITDGVKSIMDDPSNLIDTKLGFMSELKAPEKAEMLEKYQKTYSKWQRLYKNMGEYTHCVGIKNISNVYSYMKSLDIENLDIDETGSVVLKKFFKQFTKIYEGAEEIYEQLEEDFPQLVGGERVFIKGTE